MTVIAPPRFLMVKTEFPAPSQTPVKVRLGGIFVAVGVRVLVGVGVTQNAVTLRISTALAVVPFLMATAMLPYSPLTVSCWVSLAVPAAVSIKVPLVKKALFW